MIAAATFCQTPFEGLRDQGYAQVMVFTQYTDTMDFLRERLLADGGRRLMCYSGRGGEVPGGESGDWRSISRTGGSAIPTERASVHGRRGRGAEGDDESGLLRCAGGGRGVLVARRRPVRAGATPIAVGVGLRVGGQAAWNRSTLISSTRLRAW